MRNAEHPLNSSRLTILVERGDVSNDLKAHQRQGQGTDDDLFRVDQIASDFRNPLLRPAYCRWSIVVLQSLGAAAVSLASSSFAGTIPQLDRDLDMSTEVAIRTVALYVLGFALGPMYNNTASAHAL